jgi:hypothetical protein
MDNLFFPQLSSGALVQYPVKRTRNVHTPGTESEDGTRVMYFDPFSARLQWLLSYNALKESEMLQLQSLFDACRGRFRSFTFLDPIGNLLSGSWQHGPRIQRSGWIYTNVGNTLEEVSQTLAIPTSYVYTFSLFSASSDADSTVTLVRRGQTTEHANVLQIVEGRLVSSGALSEVATGFTVAVQLNPGQSIDLVRAQLEPQPSPGDFRAPTGGVYTNAHWAVDQLIFSAEAPDSFSTSFSIEAKV